eukprot:scaffold39422_cov65-Phaeocystis_antarctica.AAC.2
MDEHVLAARPAAVASAVANASAAAAAAANPEPPPPSPTLQPSARRTQLSSSAAPAMPSSRPGTGRDLRDELEELEEETT